LPKRSWENEDLLEWTISHAPTDDEPLAPESSSPRRHASEGYQPHALKTTRQPRIILGGLIVAAVLGTGLAYGWNVDRIRRDVARIVAAEDEAAFAGDIERLHQLVDESNAGWLNERDQLASIGQPTPPPTRLLRPVREPGVVRSFTTITQNIARADVARKYIAPDGTTLTFTFPQFYRYANGQWKRIPPPEDATEQQSTRTGPYADIRYFADDADFVEKDLGPYLDDVLGRACALWDCPANLKIAVNFMRYGSPYGPFYTQQPGTPLLFQLSPITFSRWPLPTLSLVSPHLMGYPTDAAGTDHLKQVAALQALLVLADRRIGGADQIHNGFFYALVARTSARLGLDSPNVLTMSTAPSSRPADDIWQKQDISNVTYDSLPSDDMQRALVILDSLLRDQPEYTDTRLLYTVNANAEQGLTDWVAAGLGLSTDGARARLEAAEADTYRLELGYRVAALPSTRFDLALGCDGGPALLSLNDPRPFYFLPDLHVPAQIISWSPDGQRLLINISGQYAIVDLAAHTATAVPNIPSNNYLQTQWTSNTGLAYVIWFPSVSLNFFDVAHPQATTPPLDDINLYVVSPDRSRAAVVVQAPSNAQGVSGTEVFVMPAPQGPMTPVDVGWGPSWSPDNQSLAYTHFDPAVGGFSLRTADLTIGLTRTLATVNDIGVNSINQFDQAAWSPTGDKIAFTAAEDNRSWIGLVNADGSTPRLLLDHPGIVDTPHFSADGKYLAVVLSVGRSPLTTIFDVVTGDQVAAVPGMSSLEWSPTGHQLVTTGYDGVFLRADPASPPQKLADGSCYNAAWKPTP
jgi:hypothetical protein